jgi:hypothetical protein
MGKSPRQGDRPATTLAFRDYYFICCIIQSGTGWPLSRFPYLN